ncbi:MAG: hypothetical protein Q8L52_03405 [bacterium]|nr:hypothetical protein [bacterium]
MEESPKFIGRTYTKEELSKAKESLERWAKESELPVEGEEEKTEEERAYINKANDLLQRRLADLSIPYTLIPSEKIHMLSAKAYEKRLGNSVDHGFTSAFDDAIFVNKNKHHGGADLLDTLIHEMVHRASKHRFFGSEEHGMVPARIGYHLASPWKKPEGRAALTGFNEIVTEYMAVGILEACKDELGQELGIAKKDIEEFQYGYAQYNDVFSKIVRGIAADKGLSVREVMDDFERGQFAENLLVLKDIDTVFGKGSLRVLACLGVLRDPIEREKVDNLVERYFSSDNQDEKANLQQQVRSSFEEAWHAQLVQSENQTDA